MRMASYMHTCRVVGNKAVHDRKSQPEYYDNCTSRIMVMSAVNAAKFCRHKDGVVEKVAEQSNVSSQ